MTSEFREFTDADSGTPFTVNVDAIRWANPAVPDGTILQMREGVDGSGGTPRIRVTEAYDGVKKWLCWRADALPRNIKRTKTT